MTDLIATLVDILGPAGVLTGADAVERAVSPWGRLGVPLAVALPKSTAEVSRVVRAAYVAGCPVVPWGGKTGLVDGAWADKALALSLERLNAVEAIDLDNATMLVGAGCVLQAACEAAEAKGLFLPLDLGARGSATIGGNISTNAGGNRVLRYGMMRDMVLGVEAVLADGVVIDCLRPLMKNNTGYDLKQLFIGSEGTLGVVTRAQLRLRPAPSRQDVALLGVRDFASVATLLRRLERDLGGALSAFEVMWPEFYELVTTPPARGNPPIRHGYAFYVLVEALGVDRPGGDNDFATVLEAAVEAGLLDDAVIAKSRAEGTALWSLRDDVFQVARLGPTVTFDVSLKIADMEAYVSGVREALRARWPKSALVVFGHLGDGNLHLIAGVGDGDAAHAVEEIVYTPLGALGGSISAEHGIGLRKRDFLPLSRAPAELAMMRTLKAALDPTGILNPGKILAADA